MAVNVTIGESQPQNSKPFPKLMIHNDGTITRFERIGAGVHISAPALVLHRGCIMWDKLIDINMSQYTDFNETLTLQNR